MLTPRSTLTRRIVGGARRFAFAHSGAARRLRQRPDHPAAAAARSRRAHGTTQYIDVERTATTPERFLRAVTAASPFAGGDAPAPGRARPSTPRSPSSRAPAPRGSEPATFLLDEFLELRTFESFPGLRQVLHDSSTASPPAATGSC